MREELLIVGDFNIHADSSNNESKGFLDIFNANGLTQHVTSPTQQKGHTLDLVITREQSNLLSGSPIVFISGVSDANSSLFILVKENCDFSTFFTNKILNIRSELGLTDTHTGGTVTNCFSGVPLNTFMDATEAEIWNIIKLSPVKSCELDPLPTWLLKECKAELVPIITDIVNMSLRESMIPKSLKTAHIRPLLKKTGLDSDILNNYRPVSNLTLISESH